MSKLVNPSRLINASGIAKLLGVSRAAVANWQKRHVDSFPDPLETPHVEGFQLWDLDEITEWSESRKK